MNIRNLYTDSTLTRNRRNDTDTQSGKAHGNIIFEISDFCYSDTRCRCNLVKCDCRTYSCLYRTYLYAEILQHLNNLVGVGSLFVLIY